MMEGAERADADGDDRDNRRMTQATQHRSTAAIGGSAHMEQEEDENAGGATHDAADAATATTAPPSSSSSSFSSAPLPVLKLRNYRPRDKSIRYTALARPSYMKDSEWLDGKLSSLVSSALAADSADVLLSIAPQSINSDLKRDLAPKLAILKRQTKQALQEMLKEKIAQQQQQEGGSDESEGSDAER